MRNLPEIVSDLGLKWDELEPYGWDKVKIPLHLIPEKKSGKLVVVTAITPTPAGEGKTTTSIGLTDGLRQIGKNAILTIRQPSLGPLFGRKGGGSGGGLSTVQPANDINLHFTGDFHAIESAHNFLAAMTDNAVRKRDIEKFDPSNITWRRVTDVEDRALRKMVIGIGGRADGPLRETGFDISAASEIMAIMALSKNYKDLRERLSEIVVGWTSDFKPISAADVGAVGSMMVLLKDALKPNLVQTQEGNPAIIHTGPFGNIAHGCSSIVADELAMGLSDYVITEAGFGADLGFEKFMDIKVRQGGPKPSVAVVVATVKALKWHGGISSDQLSIPDVNALSSGGVNLVHAIEIVRSYGLPVIVAINRFPNDHPDEIKELSKIAEDAGAIAAIEAKGFTEGGRGMIELAKIVADTADQYVENIILPYKDDMNIFEKVEILASKFYKASSTSWGPMTRTTARRYHDQGWNFPICVAKTHLSISSNPRLLGRPEGHIFPITELRVAAGARQIIALAGDIMTLPGLPNSPNALDIDLDEFNQVQGLLGT